MAAWNFSGGFDFGEYHLGKAAAPELLLIGDSHSAVLRYGLDNSLRTSGCSGYAISILGKGLFDLKDPDCQDAINKLTGDLHSVNKVVIAEYWPKLTEPGDAYTRLEEFANTMTSMNRKLYIVTNVPVYTDSPADITARLSMIEPRKLNTEWQGYKSVKQFDREQADINNKLEQISTKTGAIIVPIHMAFRTNEGYICREEVDGHFQPLYMDKDHLSPYGSNRAAKLLMRYLYPVSSSQTTNNTAEKSSN